MNLNTLVQKKSPWLKTRATFSVQDHEPFEHFFAQIPAAQFFENHGRKYALRKPLSTYFLLLNVALPCNYVNRIVNSFSQLLYLFQYGTPKLQSIPLIFCLAPAPWLSENQGRKYTLRKPLSIYFLLSKQIMGLPC